jgi:hypothetical protein
MPNDPPIDPLIGFDPAWSLIVVGVIAAVVFFFIHRRRTRKP